MKKIKFMLLGILSLCALVIITACSGISQSYADKINSQAEKKDYITYEEVMDKLGDEAIDITIAKSGVVVAVKGITSLEDLKKKIEEEDDKVEGIVITFALGNAIAAVYKKITEDDLKA